MAIRPGWSASRNRPDNVWHPSLQPPATGAEKSERCGSPGCWSLPSALGAPKMSDPRPRGLSRET